MERSKDGKFIKASLLFLSGKVKRKIKGFEVDYFTVGTNGTTLGEDSVGGKSRSGCDCRYESVQGAKRELCCSHLIACVMYRCLKPFLDKGQIKILVRTGGTDYKELKLKDEKDGD